ncbi:MAG: NAD(P)H-dependent oxidoreductase [Clostridiales bacterium]|nr:NAD(P)H-dependent oxidoreductase [Clostridiales bacterium]
MKVLVAAANTRPGSRAWKVAQKMMEGAKAAGHEVKLYPMDKMAVMGCQNCRVCRTENRNCILEDALSPYWTDLSECGAVIISAPNYNSQPSGTMITFMNRHYCMLDGEKQPKLDHDVKLLSVFAQGAPASHEAYRANYQWYLGCFRSKRLIDAGSIVVGGDSDLSEDGEIMKQAYQLGLGLTEA